MPKKIVKSNAPANYNEIMQTKVCKFALVNEKGDELHEMFVPVKCKDYLGDTLHAEASGEVSSIWGFRYDPKTQKLDRDALKIIMYVPTKEDSINFFNNLKYIHAIEDKNGIKRTEAEEVDALAIYIKADPFWLSAIWRMSLFGFLIKCMCYKFKTDDWVMEFNTEDRFKGTTEKSHFNTYEGCGGRTFKQVLEDLNKDYCNGSIYITQERNTSAAHNRNGIFSLLYYHFKLKYALPIVSEF